MSPGAPTAMAPTARPRLRRAAAAAAKEPAVVDVTMKVTEGKQYFVNRITFTGNTTTRDNVIRREIRLLEAGVFNTEALKYSIKRLNQLGLLQGARRRRRSTSRRRRAPTTRSISR